MVKQFYFVILSFILSFYGNLGVVFSEIREIKSMRQIEREVNRETLLVFDLDNTLIEPIQSLGSDQWYYYLVRKYKEMDKMSEEKAYQKADEVWNKTQWLVEVESVEKTTPQFIQKLQRKGIKMMGLTARTFDISDVTMKQLKSVGIEFKKAVYPKNLEFKLVDTAHYVQGIMYIGEQNDKGKVLVQFLKSIHYQPKKIVFVDDKQKHVTSMERALAELKIKYIGFRYGAADERVQRFNHDVEDMELFCHGTWTHEADEKFKKFSQEHR